MLNPLRLVQRAEAWRLGGPLGCLVVTGVRVADDGAVRGDQCPHVGAGGAVLEFRILGPVQAVRDGRELPLGGPRRRAVLALLLVAGGRVVPAERLADELWGASPPPGAAGTLRSHLSRLRALTGPDAALIARGGGYALIAGPDLLDAARFERLAGAGREALEHGEAAAAADRFREALGLWRGTALADVAEVEALAREGARLEELRLVAVEGRIEADVELGLAAEAAGELEGLVAGLSPAGAAVAAASAGAVPVRAAGRCAGRLPPGP